MYYHYTQNGSEVVSRIADDEWSCYDAYHGKYLYDWDFTFRRQPLAGEEQQEHAEPFMSGGGRLRLLPHVAGTPETRPGIAHAPADAMDTEAPVPICPVLSRWT